MWESHRRMLDLSAVGTGANGLTVIYAAKCFIKLAGVTAV